MAGIMRLIAFAFMILIVMVGLYATLWPVPFEPRRWTAPANIAQSEDWPALETRNDVSRHLDGVGHGPEAIATGPDGRLYTGVEDGRIISFDQTGDDVREVANVGGRPLGLKFGDDGALLIANATLGLQRLDPNGDVTTLVDQIDGVPIIFADDLAIASDGAIWFSDASAKYTLSQTMLSMWESDNSGRLLRYAPQTGETTVVLDQLAFANGVVLGPEEAYVLVAQTSAYNITRHWLKGPKAGTTDLFLDGLPAFIDNITWDDARALYWVALPAPRSADLDKLHPTPFMKKLAYRLSQLSGGAPPTEEKGWLIAVDATGQVQRHIDLTGTTANQITSAVAVGDNLWLGSVYDTAVHRLPVDQDR